MKNTKLSTILSLFSLVLLVSAFVIISSGAKSVGAAAPSNPTAYIATSSLMQVGPGNATVIALQRNFCANRVISTKGQPIMLGFSASSTAVNGFLQSASTTVAYPAAQYGCGLITAYGYIASTSINVEDLTY